MIQVDPVKEPLSRPLDPSETLPIKSRGSRSTDSIIKQDSPRVQILPFTATPSIFPEKKAPPWSGGRLVRIYKW